jgi:hypothetical protein
VAPKKNLEMYGVKGGAQDELGNVFMLRATGALQMALGVRWPALNHVDVAQ